MRVAHPYPHLAAPIALRGHTLRNRVVFGAHTANMAVEGLPTERHVAKGQHGHRWRAFSGLLFDQGNSRHQVIWLTTLAP